MAKRFITPFAEAGDRSEISDTPIGTDVNFQTGYPAEYEADPVTDPNAKYVERDKTNQLFNDITSNIKEWQERAYPDFIAASENGGVAFSYQKFAKVYHDDVLYESLVDGNTSVPPSSDWFVFSRNIGINAYLVSELLSYDFEVGRFIYISDRDFAKFKVVTGKTANGYDILDSSNGKQLELVIEKGEFNVCAFGAAGDGVTDDYLPIQRANVAAVEYANNTGNGATILYPPKDFYITSTVCPLPEGENTLDRYNAGQAGTLTTKVENINIRGYGARLICDTATFSPLFPFCMMTSIESDDVKVYGLKLESDLNDKIPNWIDPTNYFNRSVPTVTGETGFIAIRTTGFKFIDCPVHHCEVGLVITDDRTFTIPTPDPMNTYRSEVSGCDFYNCWQLISMTYGATEELLIHGNSMRYGFIKLVQESDQGRAMLITNNTFRDISGILTNTNDTQIVSNTFNNLLGGFSLQPQGGSNPSTDYNYDLTNLLIKDNTCYSDHATEVDGEAIGSGTDKPSQFLRISATSAATAGQTVNIDNLRIEGNTADLWARGGSSTGAVINRGGDAMINIKSMSVTGKNKFTIKDGATATICLAPNAAFSNTTISGVLDISGNEFSRENAASVFEFQMWFASSTEKALVKFNDNNVDMPQSVNRVVTVGGVRNFKSRGNEYNLDATAITTSAIYWMAGVKNYDIQDNDIIRDAPLGNIGYIVYHDGLTTGVYDTVNDKSKITVKNNTINVAQFVFNSNVSFPASSLGFFDLFGNTISTNTTTDFQTYPSISGFNAYNVVNPHIETDPLPTGIPLVPAYFVCWNGSFTAGTPTGWRYNGVNWRAISVNP